MAPLNGNGFWKTATITLTGVVLTGAAAWITFGQTKITRADMLEYVAQEKAIAQLTHKAHNDAIVQMQTSIEALVDGQHKLDLQIALLLQRFDQYIDERPSK
jgi:hypothetical protein